MNKMDDKTDDNILETMISPTNNKASAKVSQKLPRYSLNNLSSDDEQTPRDEAPVFGANRLASQNVEEQF